MSSYGTKSTPGNDNERKLIIVLERANLDIVKVDGQFRKQSSFQLLNCDESMPLIRKLRKDPAFCRPDIIHQCLQVLSQCPLNRAGLLQVYVRTQNNELFKVDPQFAVPESFDDFTKIMVQLLHHLRPVRSKQGSKQLLKLIKNPVTLYLPAGCPKYGTSSKAKRVVRPSELVPSSESPSKSVVIVIGAMAHESCDPDYVDETISISKSPLSAALVCAKVTSAFEDAWGLTSSNCTAD
jgi:rRNA small subunit pseudouridine methyltransferase Nep1